MSEYIKYLYHEFKKGNFDITVDNGKLSNDEAIIVSLFMEFVNSNDINIRMIVIDQLLSKVNKEIVDLLLSTIAEEIIRFNNSNLFNKLKELEFNKTIVSIDEYLTNLSLIEVDEIFILDRYITVSKILNFKVIYKMLYYKTLLYQSADLNILDIFDELSNIIIDKDNCDYYNKCILEKINYYENNKDYTKILKIIEENIKYFSDDTLKLKLLLIKQKLNLDLDSEEMETLMSTTNYYSFRNLRSSYDLLRLKLNQAIKIDDVKLVRSVYFELVEICSINIDFNDEQEEIEKLVIKYLIDRSDEEYSLFYKDLENSSYYVNIPEEELKYSIYQNVTIYKTENIGLDFVLVYFDKNHDVYFFEVAIMFPEFGYVTYLSFIYNDGILTFNKNELDEDEELDFSDVI